MESLLLTNLQGSTIHLLMKTVFSEPFSFAPDDSRTQLILLILFLLVMYIAERYDLLGLKKVEEGFQKDNGIQE